MIPEQEIINVIKKQARYALIHYNNFTELRLIAIFKYKRFARSYGKKWEKKNNINAFIIDLKEIPSVPSLTLIKL